MGASAATGGAATGLAPLLLGRLHAIFESLQSKEIGGERDRKLQLERIRAVTKEAHVITRTASALPPLQRTMVMQLSDNVKAVLASMRDMSAAEAERAVQVWERRAAAKTATGAKHVDADKQLEDAVPSPSRPAADGTGDGAAAAAESPAKPLTVDERGEIALGNCIMWRALLSSDEFVAATIAARKRTIGLAGLHVNTVMKELDGDLENAKCIDDLLTAIDELTESFLQAKRDTVDLEKLALPREGDAVATASAPKADDDAAADGEPSGFSVSALDEVLQDFEEALGSDQLQEVDAELRVTSLSAIVERVAEMQEKLLPLAEGTDAAKAAIAKRIETILEQARKLLAGSA